MRSSGIKQGIRRSQDHQNARLGSWELLPTHIPIGKISEFATRRMAWHWLARAIGGEL